MGSFIITLHISVVFIDFLDIFADYFASQLVADKFYNENEFLYPSLCYIHKSTPLSMTSTTAVMQKIQLHLMDGGSLFYIKPICTSSFWTFIDSYSIVRIISIPSRDEYIFVSFFSVYSDYTPSVINLIWSIWQHFPRWNRVLYKTSARFPVIWKLR